MKPPDPTCHVAVVAKVQDAGRARGRWCTGRNRPGGRINQQRPAGWIDDLAKVDVSSSGRSAVRGNRPVHVVEVVRVAGPSGVTSRVHRIGALHARSIGSAGRWADQGRSFTVQLGAAAPGEPQRSLDDQGPVRQRPVRNAQGRSHALVLIGVQLAHQVVLPHVRQAHRRPPRLPRLSQGGQKQPDQRRDDGNHDEQLDECEALSHAATVFRGGSALRADSISSIAPSVFCMLPFLFPGVRPLTPPPVTFLLAFSMLASPLTMAQGVEAPELQHFQVRKGFAVTVAVDSLPRARFLEMDDSETLYISRPGSGDITALRDVDGDGLYESRGTFVSGYPQVHGMCFSQGWLWFSQPGTLNKAKDTNADGVADEVIQVMGEGEIPGGEKGHWWRSLLVTPDSIYTSIGDSGNINNETTTDRQKIWKFNLDGSDKQLFASGLRNTEKLRIRPGTTEIWGCDHGSDNFGKKLGEEDTQPVTDLNPPCELNKYTQGGFYGHPFITGNRVPRYEFMDRSDIVTLAEQTIPPQWCFGAHWAPNGFCFIDLPAGATPPALPPDFAGDIVVAFHGSWNSSLKVGYQVARVLMDDGKPYGLLALVKTIDDDTQKVWARPVDCIQAKDGSILFSCDMTGRVYRIRATAEAAKPH